MTMKIQAPLVDARGVELEVGQTVVYAPTGSYAHLKIARIAKLGKRVGMIHVDNNYDSHPYVEDDLATYIQYTKSTCVVVVDALPFVADRMNTN